MSFDIENESKLESILNEIGYRIMKVYSLFRYKIPRFCRNLWFYKSFLWQDRDYDYHYLLIALKYKLTSMRDFFKDGKVVTDKEVTLDTSIDLIDEVLEDRYKESELNAWDEKWGGYDCKLTSSNDKESYIVKTSIRKALTKEQEKEAHEEYMNILNAAAEEKNRAIRLLFKIMQKEILSWWR